jgi:2-polyprenyl-3-methyl-5-hydroxy-6-metoxy-1,4-benzoquinol methylase
LSCTLCDGESTQEITDWHLDGVSVTSTGAYLPQSSKLNLCLNCSHTYKDKINNEADYYANEYGISLWHNDADQLYVIDEQKNVLFRQEHQYQTAVKILQDISGKRILDFGAAKGQMAQKLSLNVPIHSVFAYDISKSYLEYWKKFLLPTNMFLGHIPETFKETFDVITAFFVLEHTSNLSEVMSLIHSLLKEGGLFYFVVPNFQTNLGDLLVSDHVNHFTFTSITWMAFNYGFELQVIDDASHRGAFCVLLRKTKTKRSLKIGHDSSKKSKSHQNILAALDYWSSTKLHIKSYLKKNSVSSVGIYGAGFYGCYLESWLRNFVKIESFYDANPFLIGEHVNGIPIMSPEGLKGANVVIVALNPLIAVEFKEKLVKDFDLNGDKLCALPGPRFG